ncbi:MAG: MYXO-CTERM sorting domain-containing protein [Polyangiaceae bacterium]|nr:MYXO-CTERM sorting domain-containing protein [Polyangiaceae bacterium]
MSARALARGRLVFPILAAMAACAGPEAEDVDIDAPASEPEVRPDTPGNNLLFNFDRGDLVEFFDSPGGGFRVHFTRDGEHAVPADDDDSSGTPDFVEEVAGVYDDVLAFYTNDLGFRPPVGDADIADNGGDARFDVYLVDFGGSADGNFSQDACEGEICAGFMTQENDYMGYGYPSTLYANQVLGSHEFFHAVQAAYDVDQGSVLAEGTAVWATEQWDPSLDDFEGFIKGYFDNTDRPIDEPLPGPADPFSYGSAIFFQFLEEAYGAGTVRSLIEKTEDGAGGIANPYWLEVLGPMLEADKGVTFEAAYAEFARWNLFTNDFADPAEGYAASDGYPRVRLESSALPLQDPELRLYRASSQYYSFDPAGRTSLTAAVVPTTTQPDATSDLVVYVVSQTGASGGYTRTVTTLADVGAGTESVDLTGAEVAIVVVVNPAAAGDSKKPSLCVGTVDEVAACKDALGATGAGGGGGGAPGDDDGGDSETDGGSADDGADDGCGCGIAGADGPRSTFAAGLMGLAYLFARRRRRAAAATKSAR